MPGVSPGRINSLNYNTAFDAKAADPATGYAAPVWVEIDRVSDVDRTGSKQSSEVNIRASDTTIYVYGNKSREITFTYYKQKGTDPVFADLEDSFEHDTVLDIMMAEDDATGADRLVGAVGKRGPFAVAELNKSEPIDGVETYEVKLNFADAERGIGVPFLFQDFDVV